MAETVGFLHGVENPSDFFIVYWYPFRRKCNGVKFLQLWSKTWM